MSLLSLIELGEVMAPSAVDPEAREALAAKLRNRVGWCPEELRDAQAHVLVDAAIAAGWRPAPPTAVVVQTEEIERLRGVLTGGWPEAPEIQPASWVSSAADFIEDAMMQGLGGVVEDPASVYEMVRELRSFSEAAAALTPKQEPTDREGM